MRWYRLVVQSGSFTAFSFIEYFGFLRSFCISSLKVDVIDLEEFNF